MRTTIHARVPIIVALVAILLLGSESAFAQSGVDPAAKLQALVGAQMALDVQNRSEITVFGVLAVVNNVVLLPLAIAFSIVALGACRGSAGSRAGAWPWLVSAPVEKCADRRLKSAQPVGVVAASRAAPVAGSRLALLRSLSR